MTETWMYLGLFHLNTHNETEAVGSLTLDGFKLICGNGPWKK